jgi:polysaccharide deacetylase 2 family uncharacterized protein YibQ
LLRKKKKNTSFTLFLFIIVVFVLFIFLRKQPLEKKEGPPSTGKEIGEIKPSFPEEPVYRIAVIIDDVGYPSEMLEQYFWFEGKLSFSVLPFLEKSSDHARLLHEHGFEILVHIPMEPVDYPAIDPGPNALLLTDARRTVEQKIWMMIRENPYAVGANNHMGSRATQDPEMMLWTMSVLGQAGFYFIDSVTSPKTCAFNYALQEKLPAARRDVFLDNVDSYSAIDAQFEKLKQIAKKRGTAIGVGHIQRTHILPVLNAQFERLEAENISLVFASEATKIN